MGAFKGFPKRRSLVVAVTVAALTTSAVVAQDATPELTGEPVRIGIAVAESGNAALFGQEQVIGAELARDYYNSLGGVAGRPIELVFQDAGTDEATAISAFATLLATDIVAIVGPTLSQQAFAADPSAEAAGVPVIAPSNTAAGIPDIGVYISRVSAPVTVVAPNAIQQALVINPDIQNVAVMFANNDAFSVSETGVFQQTIQNLGLNLTTVQEFLTTDQQFDLQISNALATSPDLIVISGLATDGGNLVRQLRELGYTGLIVGGNGFNTPNIFPICQALCEGLIVAQAYSYLADTPINNAFRELYNEAQGREPGQFPAQAFAAVGVIVEALNRLAAPTDLSTLELADLRTQLNNEILAGVVETPLGPLSFTETGEVNQGTFYVAQVDMADDGQSGQFVLLATVTAEATPETEMEATAEATEAS